MVEISLFQFQWAFSNPAIYSVFDTLIRVGFAYARERNALYSALLSISHLPDEKATSDAVCDRLILPLREQTLVRSRSIITDQRFILDHRLAVRQ